MALPQRVLGSNHRNRWKIFKNFLLQNHLPQMLEIRFVALSSGPLPSLFKSRSNGPRWPYARGSWVWNIEIHSQMKNHLQFQNYLAQMLEIWYRGLHSWALLSLLQWWPQGPKNSVALGFGFEPLNSGERFRAIMALSYSQVKHGVLLRNYPKQSCICHGSICIAAFSSSSHYVSQEQLLVT